MDLETLRKAKNIEGCITACENNLRSYESLNEAREIRISSNNADPKVIYLSGKKKDGIINKLIEDEKERLNKLLEELKSL